MEYVVLGWPPLSDAPVIVGADGGRALTREAANALANDLQSRGYVSEVRPILPIGDVERVTISASQYEGGE